MPWCDGCSKFYNPNSVAPDGTCVQCGGFIADPVKAEATDKVPWHFWVLVAGLVLYLGWRLIQGVIVLLGWL